MQCIGIYKNIGLGFILDMKDLLKFTKDYVSDKPVYPRQTYMQNQYGIPIERIYQYTPITQSQLERTLIHDGYLIKVFTLGRFYIIKNVYWNCLMEYIRKFHDLKEPPFDKLKNCKAV